MIVKNELGKLLFYFERGRVTYQSYLENNSSFLYAKILRDNNDLICESISKVYHLLPEREQVQTLKLVHHIDVWKTLWDCLFLDLQPKPSDKFAFENTVSYPLKAEECLVNYYREIN